MQYRLLLNLIFIFTLSSCTTKVDKLDGNVFEEDKYLNSILSLKYTRYADILERNDDNKSSKYFKKLSKKASEGDFGAKFKHKLSKNNKPEQLADMYFLFNCWYYFETNNKNLGEATICKNSFLNLYLQMEKETTNIKDKITIKEKTPQDIINNIDIFFDYDSFKLNNEATEKINLLLKYINNLKTDYRIMIIGHTDRIGKPIYNNTLARRRANSVLNALIKNGVPYDLIDVKSVGSKSPNLITKRDKKNQMNRRVEIIIDTNYKSQDFIPQPILKSK